MPEPTRYTISTNGSGPSGEFVSYSDYAALRAKAEAVVEARDLAISPSCKGMEGLTGILSAIQQIEEHLNGTD